MIYKKYILGCLHGMILSRGHGDRIVCCGWYKLRLSASYDGCANAVMLSKKRLFF